MSTIAPEAPAGADVSAMLHLWRTAEYRGLVDVLDELLVDEFIGVDSTGRILDKQQWLDRHRGGRLYHTGFTVELSGVRVHGDTAIAAGDHDCAGHDSGQVFDRRCRITCVCVRTGRQWRIAALHLSEVPPSPGAATVHATGSEPAGGW